MARKQSRAARFTEGLKVQKQCRKKRKPKDTALSREYRSERYDSDMDDVIAAIDRHGMSYTAAANLSGVSRSCLVNWKTRKTRRPQHITMKFALRAIGARFQIAFDK